MTMKMKIFYGFTLILLALTSWLVVGFFWGFPGSGWQIAWLMAFLLVALGLGLAFKRMSARVRILTGLLILAGLFSPTSSIAAHPSLNRPQTFQALLPTTLFFLPSLGLVMAALLLHSGINHFKDWWGMSTEEGVGSRATRKQAGRAAVVLLVLSVLLLTKTLHNLYWLTIWDNANDSLGIFLLVVPVLAVLFCGLMLALTLPDRAKLAGLMYPVITLALMFALFTSAQKVDFRKLTEKRAEQVSQAVESYYSREGSYPQNLRKLIPRYALSLPEPVIIYGQGWCYEGGDNFYRLGYIYRDHWSSPILTGRIYKTEGPASDTSHLCDTEMAALRKHYSDYPWDYTMEGE